MPRLSVKTKQIRDKKFLTAVMQTETLADAARMTGHPTTQRSAEAIGSKKLSKVEPTMLEALLEAGVTPKVVAEEIKNLVGHENHIAKNNGITQAAKFGVGGGYAPEKSLTVNVSTKPEDMNKFDKVREKYEAELLKEIGDGTYD